MQFENYINKKQQLNPGNVYYQQQKKKKRNGKDWLDFGWRVGSLSGKAHLPTLSLHKTEIIVKFNIGCQL